MTPHGPADLEITTVIRLMVEPEERALGDVSSLQRLPFHSRVIVDVGDRNYVDDWRVVDFLAENARDRCLHLELHGSVEAVIWWARQLRSVAPQTPKRPSHLRPLEGGDDRA